MSQSEPTSQNSFIHYLWGKQGTPRFWISMIVTLALVLAVPITVMMAGQRQTIFSRAAGTKACGDACSSNGQCGGGTVCDQGKCINPMCKLNMGTCDPTLCTSRVPCGKTGCSIAESKCAKPGVCVPDGGAGKCDCSVTASPSPSPNASTNPNPSSSPSPSCSTHTSSDLNKDCKSTVEDYDLFLKDFIEQQD
jgi:hypothetical protein